VLFYVLILGVRLYYGGPLFLYLSIGQFLVDVFTRGKGFAFMLFDVVLRKRVGRLFDNSVLISEMMLTFLLITVTYVFMKNSVIVRFFKMFSEFFVFYPSCEN